MEMELRNDKSMMNEFINISDMINIIRSSAKQLTTESGNVEFLVTDELLQDIEYQMYLKREVDKAKQSIADGKSHSVEDFRKRFGLT